MIAWIVRFVVHLCFAPSRLPAPLASLWIKSVRRLVGVYRKFLAAHVKRTCLFEETCSSFSLRQLSSGEEWTVIRQRCRERFEDCCSEYTVCKTQKGGGQLIASSGRTYSLDEARPI